MKDKNIDDIRIVGRITIDHLAQLRRFVDGVKDEQLTPAVEKSLLAISKSVDRCYGEVDKQLDKLNGKD